MPIFEVSDTCLTPLGRKSLAAAALQERRDIQRLLRVQLPELLPDLLVIAEEFGEWEDSKRRIDLLALDRSARLVVIELKRGDSGSHMELQAVRYAAMVSTMTFDQAVDALARFDDTVDARERILEFLGWDAPSEEDFAQDVRIVLFCEDFSRELTSSILWLNEKGVDIVAFRMSAYQLDERVLIDFQQIIPLKEAEDYQVRVRNKQHVEQTSRRARGEWNEEFYANYAGADRDWEEARTYGFISAGGSRWYSRTLNLLSPGGRVWVNRPGVGYLGVGIVESGPIPASEFTVEIQDGVERKWLDVARNAARLREFADDPDKQEWFVRIRWLRTVPESEAVREHGFFGNQNSVAKPTSPTWIATVRRLQQEFNVED